jgi:hypothetical protein
MTVNAPNPGAFQALMSSDFVAVRVAFQNIVTRNNYITANGGASFLETAIGLSAGDAAATVAAYGNHAALAAVYQGGAPGAALNYLANAEVLGGGN